MAGNSQRKGAIKKTGKGNPTAGSGGRVKRGLEPKGPTPKAKDREYHKQHKIAQVKDRAAGRKPVRKRAAGDAEWIIGRNPVVEALREGVPVNGCTSPRVPSATAACVRRSSSPPRWASRCSRSPRPSSTA
jgi:23S rRNA (guanosine2251-2'-O)-methyltransferase